MAHAISTSTFSFLSDLKNNNHKEWFETNKKRYTTAQENMILFANDVLHEMHKHDQIETISGKKSLQRIYRDIRFSKDKTPYKSNFGGGFKRATKKLRGGYYFHIEPNNSFIAGGFWGPNTDDLKLIRSQIADNKDELSTIISSKEFTTYFGELLGEKVKTAPKGYKKDHEAIELLRYKQYLLKHTFSNEEVLSEDFYLKMSNGFKNMRPFFNYMSEILTTDLNGVPLF